MKVDIPTIKEVIKFLNLKNPYHAPFICLGRGHEFNVDVDEDGCRIRFEGIALSTRHIENIVVAGWIASHDSVIDEWEGTDNHCYYFVPQSSDVAKINPNAVANKPKALVEITKIIL